MTAMSEAAPETVCAAVVDFVRQNSISVQDFNCELWASAPAPLPLRPVHGYDLVIAPNNNNDELKNERSVLAFREWGVLVQQNLLSALEIKDLCLIVDRAISSAEEALAMYRPEMLVGKDAFCFKEIASRNVQRFDLRLIDPKAQEFVKQHVLSRPNVTWMLRNVLGTDDEIDFDVSVVYSRPGAGAQGWHADGAHMKNAKDAGWEEQGWNTRLAQPYAICVFIPLIDLNDTVGFTQFWPGSHRNRDLFGFGKLANVVQANYDAKAQAGDGVWYDYRTLHQGMPNNSSDTLRPVVQIIFKKKWYIEKANYGTESIRND
jgi:ectoine hydroxylase-related dioxygenase (phytanoyl-CoA dioxygenase family)